MKINHKPLTPPHVIFALFLTFSLLTGCMTGDDSKPAEYKLSFSANGGTGEMESITKEENEKINLPAVKFSRTGFEFLNWNTSADGSGTIASISVEEGSEITLPENTFTKSSYIFAGWATSADGDVSYSDKAKITVTGNTTLYAKWTAITYTITYEPNGGTNADGNPANYTFESETITLLAPSREYFDFGGWYTDSEFLDSSRKTEIVKGSSGNITLYAKWTVATENAVNAIKSLPAGEHKIAVTGEMTKDNLNSVMAAIKDNSNGAKVYLDLGGITIDFYDWIKCSFADCENLTGIVIPAIEPPDTEYQYELLVADVFKDCKNLKTVIILNSSDYKIGYTAFKDCLSLEYVEIPASIISIKSDAFDGCTALETITYKGTVEQWKQVKTDDKDSKYKLMSLKVQCENGTASGSDLTL